MADYLSTNTKRLKVLQTGPRGTHSLTFRFPGVQDAATMIAQARTVTAAMLVICLNTTGFISAEVAAEGSDVFLPVDWGTPQIASNADVAGQLDEYGRYVNFVGRSIGGSRVAFYLFNVDRATGTPNNRLTATENGNIVPILDALQAAGTNFVAIDQNPFVMKTYANTGINDKVGKKSRALV
jgi:hypothetical protein